MEVMIVRFVRFLSGRILLSGRRNVMKIEMGVRISVVDIMVGLFIVIVIFSLIKRLLWSGYLVFKYFLMVLDRGNKFFIKICIICGRINMILLMLIFSNRICLKLYLVMMFNKIFRIVFIIIGFLKIFIFF